MRGRRYANRMRHAARLVFALTLLCLCLLPTPMRAEQGNEGTKPPPKAQSGEDSTSAAPRPRVWWQVPALKESLGIDAAQEKALNATLEKALAARREAGQEYLERRLELTAAARGGASDARLEEILDGIERSAGRLGRVEAALVVDALGILTEKQVAELAKRYPRLLQRSWMTGGASRAAGGRMRPGGRAGRGSGAPERDPGGSGG